jgi:cytoskeletal protein RodZ
LRNYGAYLDLDIQKLLSLYRALKIQEQPVPVEELLKPHSKLPKILITVTVILIVLSAAGAGVYRFVLSEPKKPIRNTPVIRTPVEYAMDSNSMERRLYKNDSILIPVDATMYRLEMINLGEAVTIRTPGGTVILDLSQESAVDLNNDGVPNLRITAADFVKNNAEMGALLHFYLIEAIPDIAQDSDEALLAAALLAAAPLAAPLAAPGTPSPASITIIPASPNAYPFTLQSNFQGYCMFRWEILNERDRRDRNERYFQRSEELNIQAQNGVRIWTSNAQAAKFQVIGGGRVFPLELGAVGEVVVADIRWVRGDDNLFRLIFLRLETSAS